MRLVVLPWGSWSKLQDGVGEKVEKKPNNQQIIIKYSK